MLQHGLEPDLEYEVNLHRRKQKEPLGIALGLLGVYGARAARSIVVQDVHETGVAGAWNRQSPPPSRIAAGDVLVCVNGSGEAESREMTRKMKIDIDLTIKFRRGRPGAAAAVAADWAAAQLLGNCGRGGSAGSTARGTDSRFSFQVNLTLPSGSMLGIDVCPISGPGMMAFLVQKVSDAGAVAFWNQSSHYKFNIRPQDLIVGVNGVTDLTGMTNELRLKKRTNSFDVLRLGPGEAEPRPIPPPPTAQSMLQHHQQLPRPAEQPPSSARGPPSARGDPSLPAHVQRNAVASGGMQPARAITGPGGGAATASPPRALANSAAAAGDETHPTAPGYAHSRQTPAKAPGGQPAIAPPTAGQAARGADAKPVAEKAPPTSPPVAKADAKAQGARAANARPSATAEATWGDGRSAAGVADVQRQRDELVAEDVSGMAIEDASSPRALLQAALTLSDDCLARLLRSALDRRPWLRGATATAIQVDA